MDFIIWKGNLRVRDSVYYGIEKMLEAFQKMIDGESFGATIVKAINRQTSYP
jgi:NADPH-dependent curcumin reductase CurA